ncbi:MAG: cryptochrome/photolyase family protein [Tepidisphaeraceae bacterium]
MPCTHPKSAPPTVWIFEDQLSLDLPTLADAPSDAPVLMIESAHAFRMWPYHKQRLTFLIAAMRHFADELRDAGRHVHYHPLKSHGYKDSLTALRDHIKTTGSREFLVVEPSEYHTRAWLDTLPKALGITIRYFANTLFLTDRDEFKAWATRVKSPVMETFYRKMRDAHGVLMEGPDPVGGTWNLDKQNRRPFKKGVKIPKPKAFKPDDITRAAIDDVNRHFPDHPGSADGFSLPVTRKHARQALNDFLDHRLPTFGDYEDAMVSGEPVLFHSMLSFLINAGLLAPLEVVRAAAERFKSGKAPLNSVEGFCRQIIGWREYVYGIYWSFMPGYRQRNARKSDRPLPYFFWDANTQMNCLRQSVGNVVENAYSHHIQRLMVICNFATLAGLNPQAVNDWFLAMYIDSHDWVVTPNVIGMAMNADGGTMATKPYVSSAAYIHRMSDYCQGCRFNPKSRTGEDACPFNFLYWTFLHRYRAMYKGNMRMKMVLANLDRIDPDEMHQMMQERKRFIGSLDLRPWRGAADDARQADA